MFFDPARKDNHANQKHNQLETAVVRPLVLSFSVSRHPAATFGEYIRKARLEKGLKQDDVARAVGINEGTVVNWEKRPDFPPQGLAKVARLCDMLGLNLGELRGRFGRR